MQKDLFAGIVTSLIFHSESILVVGHGPFMKVYNVQTGSLLACEEVLPANRIHRIVPVPRVVYNGSTESRRLAVYGSKFLSVVQLNISGDQASISVIQAFGPFPDWIMDAQWLQPENASYH
ncbi:hypothetical protein CLU79DRAFT_282660 [Phycomyces nitens]|nr:hypothetical protein CLU79DRAFT_282660 [Phycomyces nitens]